jgi:hypothetical protein
MSTVLGIYTDAGLTTLLTTTEGIINDSVIVPVYIGSPIDGINHERKTLPGTNELQLSVVDNDTEDVLEVENFKFALSEVGLATAVAGDPLDLGVLIESGVENALPAWIKLTDVSGLVAEYPAGVSLKILDVLDSPA